MTRVNVIGAYSESAPISAHEILHGDAFGVEEMIIDDTGYAIDLTGYTMTATAEFADADVKDFAARQHNGIASGLYRKAGTAPRCPPPTDGHCD